MSYFTTTDPTTEELDYTSEPEALLDDMVRENTTTSPTAEDAELQNIEVRAPKKELTEAEKEERKERRKVEKKERREKARERDLAAKAEGLKGRGGVEMMKMRKAGLGLEGRDGAVELKDVIKRVAYLENFMKRVTSLEGEEKGGRGKRVGRVEGRGRGGGGRGSRRGGRGRGGLSAGGDY